MPKRGEEKVPLRSRMTQEVALRIPGFVRSGSKDLVVQYSLDARSSEEWYADSERKILDRLGRGYFPVFRFSDGECYFSLGYRLPPPSPGSSAILHYTRTALSAYVKYRCQNTFWSGQPGYGYEHYSGNQWRSLRIQWRRITLIAV
jgi:hypothetical protein